MWTDFQNSFNRLIHQEIVYVHNTKISTSSAICFYTTLWNSPTENLAPCGPSVNLPRAPQQTSLRAPQQTPWKFTRVKLTLAAGTYS